MQPSLVKNTGFLKERGELPDGVPAKIVKILYGGWSPMGEREYEVILIENAHEGRSIILHKHWGPDRSANADWFDANQGNVLSISETGFISCEVFKTCLDFVRAKEEFKKLSSDVWSILC